VVRALPGVAALFGGTVLIGAAIATGNVLMPALVKRDFAHRTGLMTAAYSASISVGGAMGAALTAPLADGLGLGWRAALGAWALWAVAAAVCWLPQLRRVARPPASAPPVTALRRSPIAWQVTAYMSLTGIAGGMAAPVLAARSQRQRWLAVLITVTTAIGLAGVLVPGVELVACVVLGIGQGAALGLALTLMTVRAPDSAHAAQLSGMAQCLGYMLAATGPFAVGALHDLTDGWTVPLVVLLVLLVPQAVVGMLAGRDRSVTADM
jgi:CP family cyanate transporter-like MFS transporter